MPRIWSEAPIILLPGARTDILAPVDVVEVYVVVDATVAGALAGLSLRVMDTFIGVAVAAGPGPITAGGVPWIPIPASSRGCGQQAMVRIENQGPNPTTFGVFWRF